MLSLPAMRRLGCCLPELHQQLTFVLQLIFDPSLLLEPPSCQPPFVHVKVVTV